VLCLFFAFCSVGKDAPARILINFLMMAVKDIGSRVRKNILFLAVGIFVSVRLLHKLLNADEKVKK